MGHSGTEHIGSHDLIEVMGLTFHLDTLIMTWITMGIVIVIAVLATRRLSIVPHGWQTILEMVVTALLGQIESTMGPRGKKLAPLFITLFLFLLIANWLGLVPTFKSPTADLNTTLGMALMVVIMLHSLGLMYKRGEHLKSFFKPFAPFVIIKVVEEIAKPITLSFRLFGNILAGEVLIIILGLLVPMWFPVPNIVWLAFSVFVGAVQAFIFTMLSMSYIGEAIGEEH